MKNLMVCVLSSVFFECDFASKQDWGVSNTLQAVCGLSR